MSSASLDRASVYIVAGEPSGDLHGAGLVTALAELHPDWSFRGFGGARMEQAGVELRANLVDKAVMGLTRVAAQMGFVLDVAARFLHEIRTDPPDLVVLIDYPGLNLNLARMAKRHEIPVVYYICPQVWAWAHWRIRHIVRRADLLLVILPFEEKLYGEQHSRVHFIGNPVFDHLDQVERTESVETPERRRLALFPGSRAQEVEGALPAMARIARALTTQHPDLEVCVSCQRPALVDEIGEILADTGLDARIWQESAHTLQRTAYLSLVVSGTATLEQAFFGVPMVVMYPASPMQRRLFRFLSVTPFISLVNLFAGRRVVPEFLFSKRDEGAIAEQALRLIEGQERERMQGDLKRLREQRFQPGAAGRAAQQIVTFLETAKVQ